MKTLTIRFINEPDLISRLITWQTDSLFCHTEGLSRDGQSWVGAHSGTGVQARPLNWVKPTFEKCYKLPVSDDQYEAAMSFMDSKIGYPYDYEDIVGMLFHKRLGLTDHQVICSAFMLMWLQAAGLQPLNVLAGYDALITPETLHLSPILIGHCVVE